MKSETIQKAFIEPSKLVNGTLIIGYDISNDKDHCCLLVMKKTQLGGTAIINEFWDEEASEIYQKLVSKN